MNLNISEASKYLKVSKDTLRRWEKRGYIKPLRTPSGRRVYQKDQLDNVLKPVTQIPNNSVKNKGNFIYILFVLFLIIDIVLFFLLRITK